MSKNGILGILLTLAAVVALLIWVIREQSKEAEDFAGPSRTEASEDDLRVTREAIRTQNPPTELDLALALRGRVLSVTGEHLGQASLEIRVRQGSESAKTRILPTSGGRFAVDISSAEVATGVLQARAPGFDDRELNLSKVADLNAVEVVMTPVGFVKSAPVRQVRGRVVDEEQVPLPHTKVVVLEPLYPKSGLSIWEQAELEAEVSTQVCETQTDANGEFLVSVSALNQFLLFVAGDPQRKVGYRGLSLKNFEPADVIQMVIKDRELWKASVMTPGRDPVPKAKLLLEHFDSETNFRFAVTTTADNTGIAQSAFGEDWNALRVYAPADLVSVAGWKGIRRLSVNPESQRRETTFILGKGRRVSVRLSGLEAESHPEVARMRILVKGTESQFADYVDGTFVFEQVPKCRECSLALDHPTLRLLDGKHLRGSRLSGRALGDIPVEIPETGPAEIKVKVADGGRARVKVLHEGLALAGVPVLAFPLGSVLFHSTPSSLRRAITDQQGVAEFRGLAFVQMSFWVDSTDWIQQLNGQDVSQISGRTAHIEYFSRTLFRPGGPEESLTLAVVRTASVEGRVTFPDGRAAPGVVVRRNRGMGDYKSLLNRHFSSWRHPMNHLISGASSWLTTPAGLTDHNGVFRIEGLAPGASAKFEASDLLRRKVAGEADLQSGETARLDLQFSSKVDFRIELPRSLTFPVGSTIKLLRVSEYNQGIVSEIQEHGVNFWDLDPGEYRVYLRAKGLVMSLNQKMKVGPGHAATQHLKAYEMVTTRIQLTAKYDDGSPVSARFNFEFVDSEGRKDIWPSRYIKADKNRVLSIESPKGSLVRPFSLIVQGKRHFNLSWDRAKAVFKAGSNATLWVY